MPLIIEITPEVERRLQKEADRRGLLPTDLARSVLESHVIGTTDDVAVASQGPQPQGRPDDGWDVLASLIGSIDGPRDWADEHEHYIYGTPKKGTDTVELNNGTTSKP